MDDWMVVDDCAAEGIAENPAYDKIEQNMMDPCRVSVGEKALLFCLEPKTMSYCEEIRACADNLTGKCSTCRERITKFAHCLGSGGKHIAFCQDVAEPSLDKIRELRSETAGNATSTSVKDYSFLIVDKDFADKYPVKVGPFDHVHFVFEELSNPDFAARMRSLSSYINGSFENRFERLVNDPASLEIIENELPSLVRPDHWKSVVSWARKFVAKAGGRSWSALQAFEKFEVMVFAMLSGRAQGSVHLDMQQAGNLVDFMDDANDTHSLRTMMDERSNPETYQVSRVAELLREKRVTSLCTVTLTWGKDGHSYQSDLDLHTTVGGQELYYGTPTVGKCTLDFDANASRVEKNPAENISLNEIGTFHFRVNNFLNRDNADVPFEVTVRKPGFQEVHCGVWPRDRQSGDFLPVCTVSVTAADLEEKPAELSEAEQQKLSAKEQEWASLFGDVRSVLATDQDLELMLVKKKDFSPSERVANGAQEVFSELLVKKKSTLAERCKLETLRGFIKHVTENSCTVEITPRDFVPGYITRIETKTQVVNETAKYAINVYHRKHEIPQQPRCDEQSTARFDDSWGLSSKAIVRGFVEINKVWFMVLQDAHLPQEAAWPLGGGMYPTHLRPEVHHHRSKWTSFHSLVRPSSPTSGLLLVGSALVGMPTFQFILDGRNITVRGD